MDEGAELSEILALTRAFALAELRPRTERWERDGELGDDIMAQLAELGFLGMLVPETAGGMGLDPVRTLAAVRQLAWGEASVGLAVALHTQVTALLVRAGSAAARAQWLPALASGEVLGCTAAAPAPPNELRATADGAGWKLAGTVPWVGNARPQGLLAALAGSDAGPLLCLVPLAAAGVKRASPAVTLGLRPLALRTVVLDDVRLPPEAVLAGPGSPEAEGAVRAEAAALSVAAVATGLAQAALDHARDYAAEREQFGRKLRDFEGIGRKLAEMALSVGGARALLDRAAAAPDPAAVALAKVAAAESAMYVTTQAVQVFGGYGYMRDYPVEKLMRDARAMSLLGGRDEEHKARITEWLYVQ